MAKVRVKMQDRGSRNLLTSREVQGDIQRRTESMAATAGEGFEPHTVIGRNRVLGSVSAATFDALKAESENFALTRSLDAAR